MTGILNLNTTCGMPFAWRFIDPYFYAAIIYLDSQKMIEDKTAVWLYVLWTSRVLVSYLMFMTSVIGQLTSYLNISFLRVKQPKVKKS